MNARYFIDAIAHEAASIAALVDLGNQVAHAPFTADGAGSVQTHAASMLSALSSHQMRSAATTLAAMSCAEPGGLKTPFAADATNATARDGADSSVIDVEAVEVTDTPLPTGSNPEQ